MQFVDFTKNTLFFCQVRRASPTSISIKNICLTPLAQHDGIVLLAPAFHGLSEERPVILSRQLQNTAEQGTLSYYAQDRKEIKETTRENRWWESSPDAEAFRGWWIARNTFTSLSVGWCDMDEAMLPNRPRLYTRGWDGTWKNDTGLNCRKTLKIKKKVISTWKATISVWANSHSCLALPLGYCFYLYLAKMCAMIVRNHARVIW